MNMLMGVSLLLVAFLLGLVRGQSMDGRARLNNKGYTNTNAGVVEVYYNGEWGMVCDYWNYEAATVVCRQTGFAAAIDAVPWNNYYDPTLDPQQVTWLKDVYCQGDESTLANCVDNPPTVPVSCPRNSIATVLCADARLVDTSKDGYSGRVEVYNKGQWYGICGSRWNRNDALVVCDMLFPWESSSADVSGYSVQYTSTDRAVPAIRCSGDEDTLNECQAYFDSLMLCSDNTRAAVTCVELEDKKKEVDLKDDLKIRAAQLLLQLLQESKK